MSCDVYEFNDVQPLAQTYRTSSVLFHWDSLRYFSRYANRLPVYAGAYVQIINAYAGPVRGLKVEKSPQNGPGTGLLERAFVPCVSLALETDKLNRCVSLAIFTLTAVANVPWRDVRLYAAGLFGARLIDRVLPSPCTRPFRRTA